MVFMWLCHTTDTCVN